MPQKYELMKLGLLWCASCKAVVDCEEYKRSWYKCGGGHEFHNIANMEEEVKEAYYEPVEEETWWEEEFRNRKELEEMREEFVDMRKRAEVLENEECNAGDTVQEDKTDGQT